MAIEKKSPVSAELIIFISVPPSITSISIPKVVAASPTPSAATFKSIPFCLIVPPALAESISISIPTISIAPTLLPASAKFIPKPLVIPLWVFPMLPLLS